MGCLPAFQRSLIPARSLLPERFRGPVAPSAAEAFPPLSPAPGGWDATNMQETESGNNDGYAEVKGMLTCRHQEEIG